MSHKCRGCGVLIATRSASPPRAVCYVEGLGWMHSECERRRQAGLRAERTPASLRETQHGGQHYKGMAIQPAEYCHRNELRFCESEAIKYLSRFRSKNGAEDVKKAIHFCQMILDMEYGLRSEVVYDQGDDDAEARDTGGVPDREDAGRS